MTVEIIDPQEKLGTLVLLRHPVLMRLCAQFLFSGALIFQHTIPAFDKRTPQVLSTCNSVFLLDNVLLQESIFNVNSQILLNYCRISFLLFSPCVFDGLLQKNLFFLFKLCTMGLLFGLVIFLGPFLRSNCVST